MFQNFSAVSRQPSVASAHNRAVLVILVVAGMTSSVAMAQTRSWAAPVNGNWGTASAWSPADVPDTASEEAVLGLSGAYTVSTDASYSVRSLSIPNPEAMLYVVRGTSIFVGTSGLTLTGNVLINSNPNCCTGASISLTNNSALSGSGVIFLGDPANAYLTTTTSGIDRATIDPGVSIGGSGIINGNFTNKGTIGGGLQPGPTINDRTVTQMDAGRIYVDTEGFYASIGSGVVEGGTITTANGGIVQTTAGNARVDGVTMTAGTDFRIQRGTGLTVLGGGLVNDGSILINSNPNCCTPASLVLVNGTSITGAGTITLADLGNSFIDTTSDHTDQANIGAGITIRGSGNIAGNIVNNGLLAPGTAIGTINRTTGNIVQTPSATIQIDLRGAGAGDRDSIGGSGGLTLNGKLQVRFLNGYTLPVGQAYTMISGGTIQGKFAQLDLPTLPTGVLLVEYGVNSVTIRAVKCPSDFNGDGFVNGDDFDGYVDAFEAGNVEADFNRDGFVTGDDFDAFVAGFAGGC